MASNTVVQTNIQAMNTHRNMKNVGTQQQRASEKLSSGYKINRAADDATGLAISEKMRAQIRGLDMASKNVSDAVSLIATAEGGMQGIDDMLHRIRELVDFAANDTNENNKVGTGDRQKIQDEIDQLVEEIDSMSERVEFNKKKLIDGSFQDTKAQLANATALYNSTNLEKTAATAKYQALQASLKTALGTHDTGFGAAAGLNGDGTELAGAQDKLDYGYIIDSVGGAWDPATMTFGDIDQTKSGSNLVYQAAVKEYTEAEVDYTAAWTEYKAASEQLNTALANAKLNSLADLTTANFDSTDDVNYLGPEKGAALTSAINRYNDAAKAFGLDEANLQGIADAVLVSAGLDSSGGAFTQVVANTGNTVDGADLTWKAANTAAAGGKATGQIGVFSNATTGAKDLFATRELNYQTDVANRDAKQAKVNSIQDQLTEATQELNSANTRFNAASISYNAAKGLDDKSDSRALHFQVGSNANQSLLVSIGSLKSDTLGIGDGKGNTASLLNVVKDTGQDITSQLDVLDQALSYVTTERSKLGAAQNRMEYTQQSLDITSENISDAESRIRDTDMAKEMMNYTKANILQQVSVSMMAQANQVPQSVLQLLR